MRTEQSLGLLLSYIDYLALLKTRQSRRVLPYAHSNPQPRQRWGSELPKEPSQYLEVIL